MNWNIERDEGRDSGQDVYRVPRYKDQVAPRNLGTVMQ